MPLTSIIWSNSNRSKRKESEPFMYTCTHALRKPDIDISWAEALWEEDM